MNTATVAALEPGWLADLTNEEYHGLHACSSSALTHMLKSPAYCKWRTTHEEEPSDAVVLGDLCHIAALQPELFVARFCVIGQCEAVTGKGTRCTNQGSVMLDGKPYCGVKSHAPAEGVPDPRKPVTVKQWNTAQRVREAVYRHPMAGAILNAADAVKEQPGVWVDEATGLLCKCKPDVRVESLALLADLKVTVLARPDDFPRFLRANGVYRQAAHYLDGAAVCGSTAQNFLFIACHPDEPNEVYVYDLKPDTVDAGRREVRRLRAQYAACQKSGVWGYPQDVIPMGLDRWALAKLETTNEETTDA